MPLRALPMKKQPQNYPDAKPALASRLLEEFQKIEGVRTITMGGIEAPSGFSYQNVLGALRALDLIERGHTPSST